MSSHAEDAPLANSTPKKAAATRQLADVLKKTGSISVNQTPLHQVCNILAAEYHCHVRLDHRSLDEAGVRADTPCTITLKDVSLDSTLRQLLTPHGLKYVVRDEVILITADERPKPAVPKVTDPAKPNAPAGKASAEKPVSEKKPAEALTYTGHVTDKLTGKPIAGATVTVRRQIVARMSIASLRSPNTRPTRRESIPLPSHRHRPPCP